MAIGGISIALALLGLQGWYVYTHQTYYENEKKETYFTEYKRTKTKAEGDYNNRLAEGFTLNGVKYVFVTTMEVAYLDEDRGDAVANLDKHTIYDYYHKSGLKMVCLGREIYCNEEDTEKLLEYYYNQPGSMYYYSFTGDNAQGRGETEIDDKMFNLLHDMPENELKIVERNSTDNDYIFKIYQTSADGEVNRYISLGLEGDKVFMVIRYHNFSKNFADKYDHTDYYIINKELHDYWYSFMLEKIELKENPIF